MVLRGDLNSSRGFSVGAGEGRALGGERVHVWVQGVWREDRQKSANGRVMATTEVSKALCYEEDKSSA